jgi:hypothetical protein
MFNKDSSWTIQDFLNSDAHRLMRWHVDTKIWIPESQMTDQEKADNRGYKAAEGYIKDIPFKEAFTNAWHNWSDSNKAAFTSLPNFDATIFEEITGVKI